MRNKLTSTVTLRKLITTVAVVSPVLSVGACSQSDGSINADLFTAGTTGTSQRSHEAAPMTTGASLRTTGAPSTERSTRQREPAPAPAAPRLGSRHNRSAQTAPPAADDSPIYHSSEDWGWLKTPGLLIPGAKYINITSQTACSTGWLVSGQGRSFVLTAGHCGEIGDEVAVKDRNGNFIRAGTFVESVYDRSGDDDFGLIEINRTVGYDSSLPLNGTVEGAVSPQWLDDHRPRICRLGYRTGMSCGDYLRTVGDMVQYRGIVDHGDSGGPVFALYQGELYAVGMAAQYPEADATRNGASLAVTALDHWGLSIHR